METDGEKVNKGGCPPRNEEEHVVHILRHFNENQRWKEQVLDKKLLYVHEPLSC